MLGTNAADGQARVILQGPKDVVLPSTAWPASVTPYGTTTTSKLAAGTPITLAGGRFSASLAAQSVTTFVGKP